jgi:hypothetical protein
VINFQAADLDLRRTPMIGFFLMVEIADAGDKWMISA